MKFGIPISLFIHAAFLGGGIFLFNEVPTLPDERAIIPIDIVTVAEQTNIKAAVQREKPRLQPEPEISQAQLPPEEILDTASSALPALVRAAEAEAIAEETAEDLVDDAEPADTPTEDAPAFNLDDLSALIDRSRDSQADANPQIIFESEENLYAFADINRLSAGVGDSLALSEIDALRAAMYRCWRIPADAKNPESLIIPVEVQLYRDGHLASARLQNPGAIYGSSNPYMKIAGDNALRAVSKCAPYDFLPAERYEAWKQMTLTFRPIISQ